MSEMPTGRPWLDRKRCQAAGILGALALTLAGCAGMAPEDVKVEPPTSAVDQLGFEGR